MTSTHLYSAVTKYWPRIAAGLVIAIGLMEFVVGGLTADSGIEVYLMAWAATTGGLWFLFEKAEQALSDETRRSVAGWVRHSDLESGIDSIPEQFVTLFDRVFGRRHVSLRCFAASVLASIVATALVTTLWLAIEWPWTGLEYETEFGRLTRYTTHVDYPALFFGGGTVLVLAALFNVLPDYASLLQTRLLIRFAHRRGGLAALLVMDLVCTMALSAGFMYGAARLTLVDPLAPSATVSGASTGSPWESNKSLEAAWDLLSLQPSVGPLQIDALTFRHEREVVQEPFQADERAIISFTAEMSAGWCRDQSLPWRSGSFELTDECETAHLDRWGAPYQWVLDNSNPTVFDLQEGLRRDPSLPRVAAERDSLLAALGAIPPQYRVNSHGLYAGGGFPLGVFFYSAFFTSVWLWLYAASVLVSRVLLRMNSGVGFLLRVTDVEQQPFRSMGFVSVIIVSGLFALGLPLVLL